MRKDKRLGWLWRKKKSHWIFSKLFQNCWTQTNNTLFYSIECRENLSSNLIILLKILIFLSVSTRQVLVSIFLLNLRIKHCVEDVFQRIRFDSPVFWMSHVTFLFFEIEKRQLKWNNELQMLETNSGWSSSFHSLNKDNHLNFEKNVILKVTCIYCHPGEYLTDCSFRLVYTSLARRNAYFSSLNTTNQIYSRDCDKEYFYYESIQVKVNTSGYYSFRSDSTMDTYQFIYKITFNPLKPSENFLPGESRDLHGYESLNPDPILHSK